MANLFESKEGGSIHNKITAAGLIITLGIVYGDLGTSPLYVLKAIIGENAISVPIIKGAISCIFWTLTLQTTLKYVVLTLRADNKGEGGVFALFTSIKRLKIKWLLFPAIIGGSALLADGIITPSITVTSAIEGLNELNPNIEVIPIVITIITILFLIQQFGSKSIGKFFGPAMFFWFLMIGFLGAIQIFSNFNIFTSLNPYYAYTLLFEHPSGFLVLGAVFLCTTGAEALYSDLGHCGLKNIRISWIFVKAMLMFNYLGQGAWLISHQGMTLKEIGIANPFFGIMADWFVPFGVVVATLAAVIASQALISGSFTLISEAMQLNLWMKMKVKYPSSVKGQLYLPTINWLLYIGCIFIVIYFQNSSGMEAAYGLAIVLSMITTTILLVHYMWMKKYNKIFIVSCAVVYGLIELSFLYANLDKFFHGGWITILIAAVLSGIMLNFHYARIIKRRFSEYVKLPKYLPTLSELSNDMSVSKYATHLIYLTEAEKQEEIEANIIYSILQQQPKRADIYWFIHVNIVDEPYRMEYEVKEFVRDDVIRLDFTFGFRNEPRISFLFKKVVEDLIRKEEVDINYRYHSLFKDNLIGDVRYLIIRNILSYENELPIAEKFIMDIHVFLSLLGLSYERAYGLDSSSVTIETAPMVLAPMKNLHLKRINK